MNVSWNTNSTVRRRIAAIGVVAIVLPAFAACSAEVSPPQQNIGQDKAEKKDRTTPGAEHTSPNRSDFGDEYGKAKLREKKARPAGSGTRNRLDFGDDSGR